MIRKLTRKEETPCVEEKDCEACKKEAEAENACDALEVEALVDLAVKALAEYGVNEIEYEEGEEPDENEAICADEDGNEVGIEVKDNMIKIDLDEEEDLIVKLDQPVEDVESEIRADLEEKLADQEAAEECARRFEAWKRERRLRALKEQKNLRKERKSLRRENKRVPSKNRK